MVETRDIRTQEVKDELYKTIGNQHIDLIDNEVEVLIKKYNAQKKLQRLF